MIKGIRIALAILVYSFLPGMTGLASAYSPSITTELIQTSCQLSPFTIVSYLKNARLTTRPSQHSLFVPAVFTQAKDPNGSLSATIGVSVVDPNDPTETTEQSTDPVPTITPTPEAISLAAPQANPSTGLNPEILFSMSNAYRGAKGLPPFQKDERACQLAASRAPEIAAEIAGGYMHAGLRARNLPYWDGENIITMRTEQEAFSWWINDTIHREQIEGNYTYSCVACSGNACVQEFTNFTPKQ